MRNTTGSYTGAAQFPKSQSPQPLKPYNYLKNASTRPTGIILIRITLARHSLKKALESKIKAKKNKSESERERGQLLLFRLLYIHILYTKKKKKKTPGRVSKRRGSQSWNAAPSLPSRVSAGASLARGYIYTCARTRERLHTYTYLRG